MAGLYIHIPFCARKCAYCDFPSYAGREGDSGRFFSAMIREAEMWHGQTMGEEPGPVRSPAPTSSRLSMNLPYPPLVRGDAATAAGGISSGCSSRDKSIFSTVFIGGGTPSLLPAGELERLMDRLKAIFNINPIEFTVEANPGTVDKAKLESFRHMGATRISFGVQAAQDHLLRRIGRIHTWEDFHRSYQMAREAGFMNINADMMTGLPGQTVNEAVDTAQKLVMLGVEHVSCYGLILEEGTPLAAAVEDGVVSVPDGDAERGMFHAVREVLKDAGLRRYEISNFAKPGLECLHNLNYWHNGNWLGLGSGAASHWNGRRWENHPDIDGYISALEQGNLPQADEHDIWPDEAAFETVMLELRLVDGIDFARFEARHGFGFMQRYGEIVKKQMELGLMLKTPSGVALTGRGMDLQNAVLMEFME